ncbi:hypothetical protein [Beijerinckia sp. L45]|uniref:hypothetical protein n=1 Tax=Beijerinckia sp. L45 TaxID=1641855 RepID=UPI00131B39B3|nr:hypothetical protein [Beijerinckia sp. L45]
MHEVYAAYLEHPIGVVPIDLQTWRGTTLVPTAVRAAQRLVAGAKGTVAPDGAALAVLEDGRIVALFCVPNDDIQVFAAPTGAVGFVATMSEGFLTSLFSVLAGLWTQPGVMAGIGHVAPLAKPTAFPDLAPGLEHLAWSLQTQRESRNDRRPESLERADWLRLARCATREITGPILNDRLAAMDRTRRALFEASFLAAVNFTWLHELAHILRGHLDTTVFRQRRLDMAETTPAVEPAMPAAAPAAPDVSTATLSAFHYGAEVEADAWAARRLAAQREHGGDGDRICARLIGITAVFILLHGKNVLLDQPDHALKHPPIWYRAILTMRNAAPPSQFERILGELQAIADVHPLFGEWLDPIARGDGFRATATLEAKVVAEFEPWIAELAGLRQSFACAQDR